MIALQAVVERTQLVDPSGARAEQVIEHRTDPLTGAVASVNTALGEKARAFLGTPDLELLRDLQERSKVGCPFCSAPEKGTRFVPELVPEGQLRIGSALAMPNLFSKCASDSVVILDPAMHVLFPSLLRAGALADAIRASVELIRRVRARDPSLVHHVAGMNFLNPGGSSVPHPHFQVHVRSVPYSGVERLLRRAAAFRARQGTSYWRALLEQERAAGERYVGRTGEVEWLVPYAPSHQNEVWGLLPGVGSLAELADGHAAGFSEGIARVVSFYERGGMHPFTFAFLSSPQPGRGDEHDLQVRICSRPAFKALYANYDTWFTPKFVGDEVHVEAPERYAEALRARW
jgi:UDPglucose--hexose-1-phosphate uridylyltransferase